MKYSYKIKDKKEICNEPQKKNYKIDIYDEINKKINSINIVRNARIKSSERMQYYSKHWTRIFFVFNLLAIIFVMTSLVKPNLKGFTEVTSFFTLYVIILQYYVAARNYNERSLRYHYHQLELEQNILDLKEILISSINSNNKNSQEDIIKYLEVMKKYNINLQNIENHQGMDYRIGNKAQRKFDKIIFGYNIGIIIHYAFCIIIFIYFILTVLSPEF